MLGVAVLMLFFFGFWHFDPCFYPDGRSGPWSLARLGALKMGDFGIAKVLSCTLACVGPSGFFSFWKTSFLATIFSENSEQ